MIAGAGFHYTFGVISLSKLANAHFFITPSHSLYNPTSTITSIKLKTYKQIHAVSAIFNKEKIPVAR
jgi:hypothetical protein